MEIAGQRVGRIGLHCLSKGARLAPFVGNVWAPSLNEMAGKPLGIAAPGVGIAGLGSTNKIGVQQAEQARVSVLIPAMRGGGQKQHVPLRIFGKALEQRKALLRSLFATAHTTVRLIDNHEFRTGVREILAAAVCLDVVEADHGVGMHPEHRVAQRNPLFERARPGRCDGDGIDVELLAQLAHPLIDQMRRTKHGEAVDFATIQHLAQDHPRLDGLADANVVRDQHTLDLKA